MTWTYEALDRPTFQYVGGAQDLKWMYDSATNGAGYPYYMLDAAGGQLIQAYDLLGRTTSEVYGRGGANHMVATSCDPLGQILSRTYPDNRTVSRIYDARGYLGGSGTTGPAEYATNWSCLGFVDAFTLGSEGVRDGEESASLLAGAAAFGLKIVGWDTWHSN